MPIFEVLEQRGLEVFLVNAQHTKNVPGRKSDVAECLWLLKLHAFGLLRMRSGWPALCGATIQRFLERASELDASRVVNDVCGGSVPVHASRDRSFPTPRIRPEVHQ